MREEVEEEDEGSSNWFARWEDDLPKPEELMPLSQSLITPDLAHAFDIPTASAATAATFADSSTGAGGANGSPSPSPAEEPARTLKRPRLVWTPQLHKRFVDAVAHLGIKNAVPKTIMQLMGVDGLTRENVASHLQKYRLYLKRMQSLHSTSSPSSATGGGGPISAADHQLFASTPVPHHFLGGRGPPPPEPFCHLGPAGIALPPQHQYPVPPPPPQPVAVPAPYYQQRQMGGFGSPGGFEHGFSSRGAMPMGMQGMGVGLVHRPGAGSFREYREDLEMGERGGGRRELALFPTGED